MRPPTFFFYSSLEPPRREWIEKLLSDKQIYFRSKANLADDINELRPGFEMGGDEISQRHYFQKLTNTLGKNLPPANRLLTKKNLERQHKSKSGLPIQRFHELLDRVGVLSLSETIRSHILWGRYANSYSGITIEFDSNKGLFALAQQVNYELTLPVVQMLGPDDIFYEKAVLTKLRDWESQREWRVIGQPRDNARIESHLREYRHPPDVESFIRASHGPGYYAIPEYSIKSIIMGPNISEADRLWLQLFTGRLGMKHLLIDAVRNHDGSISKVVDQARHRNKGCHN
jgi:hypothetical protein